MSIFFGILAAFTLALSGGAAGAQPLPVPTVAYSAERVLETEQGSFTQRLHYACGKERSETDMGGLRSVVILRPDRGLGWMLMPAQRTYQQLDLAHARQQAGSAPAADVEVERVGTEIVAGREATKYRLVARDEGAGGFVWFTAEGIPVQMDLLSRQGRRQTRIKVSLRNLQIGPQDPALFELPEGYAPPAAMGLVSPTGALQGMSPFRR